MPWSWPTGSGCDVTGERLLIVNADDFGRTPGINRGVVRAHEEGVVTSASLMVRWPAAAAAADYGRERPALSLGIHLDLGEWAYRNERWQTVYEVVTTADADAVAAEVARQLAQFRRLVGRDPTHVDSHQHVHLTEPVHGVVLEAAGPLGVPVRGCTPEVCYRGDFYGQTGKGEPDPQANTVDALVKIVAALPPGTTELGCHPGIGDDFDSVYRRERAAEVAALCDPKSAPPSPATGCTCGHFPGPANPDDRRRGSPGGAPEKGDADPPTAGTFRAGPAFMPVRSPHRRRDRGGIRATLQPPLGGECAATRGGAPLGPASLVQGPGTFILQRLRQPSSGSPGMGVPARCRARASSTVMPLGRRLRMTRAGVPATIENGGIGPFTSDCEPITLPEPMSAPRRIDAFSPTQTSSPMRTGVFTRPCLRIGASRRSWAWSKSQT